MDISSDDIIRLMLQFLSENGLTQSLQTLQKESGISLNIVPDLGSFKAQIVNGKWDSVLKTLLTVDLPPRSLVDLYEIIVMELISLKETSAARSLLRQSDPMEVLKNVYPDRYLALEEALAHPHSLETDTKARRIKIADDLEKELMVVAPSRLLSLLSESVQWELSQGLIHPEAPFDLFKGSVPIVVKEEDAPVSSSYGIIKLPKKQHAESVAFSPDGTCLATGSVDGIIEIWNYLTGKLRKDLRYQAQDEFMIMESAVLALAFSSDSESLISADQEGRINVWKVVTGQCLKRFSAAHTQGITSVRFNADASLVLSTSFDNTLKLHGLKSGRTLKEFRGHSSFVNEALFSNDGSRIVSGSSDGTLRIWDSKSTESLYTVYLSDGKVAFSSVTSPSIHQILSLSIERDVFLVCNHSPFLYVANFNGQVVKSLTHKKPKGSDFVSVAKSPQGEFVYGASDDGFVYCFQVSTAKLVGTFKATENEIIGSEAHPFCNVLVVYDDQGALHLWK